MESIRELIGRVSSHWSAATTIGTFLVYLCGYLALRFHQSASGAVFETPVLNENYLFVGFAFIVNLVASLPVLALLVVVCLGLRAALRGLLRLSGLYPKWEAWRAAPARTALAPAMATLFCLAAIQFWMRECFSYLDLYRLAPPADDSAKAKFFYSLLAPPADGAEGLRTQLFFCSLLALCLAGGLLARFAARHQQESDSGVFLTRAAFVLWIIMLLLLPVNYGILIRPFVASSVVKIVGDDTVFPGKVWLVDLGKEWMTLLVEHPEGAASVSALKSSRAQGLVLGPQRRLLEILAEIASHRSRAPAAGKESGIARDETMQSIAVPQPGGAGGSKKEEPRPPAPGGLRSILIASAKIAGLASIPQSLRDVSAGPAPGQLLYAPANGSARPSPLTNEGGFLTPVFDAGGKTVFALRSRNEIWRIPFAPEAEAQSGSRIWQHPGGETLYSLFGVSPAQPPRLLLVFGRSLSATRLGWLNLGRRSPALEWIEETQGERSVLQEVRGMERHYAAGRITYQPGNYLGLKYMNVLFTPSGATEAINVSKCGFRGDSGPFQCDQAALSDDGRWIVFVRSEPSKPEN
jgi:hypothetical protein